MGSSPGSCPRHRPLPRGTGTVHGHPQAIRYLPAAFSVVAGVLVQLANGEITLAHAIEIIQAAGLFSTLQSAVNVKAGAAVTSFLTGKKTWLVGLAAVAAAMAGMASGDIGLVDGVQVLATTVMSLFLRAGITQRPFKE